MKTKRLNIAKPRAKEVKEYGVVRRVAGNTDYRGAMICWVLGCARPRYVESGSGEGV